MLTQLKGGGVGCLPQHRPEQGPKCPFSKPRSEVPRGTAAPPSGAQRGKGGHVTPQATQDVSPCDAQVSQSASATFLKNKPIYFIHKHLGTEQLPDYMTSILRFRSLVHQWVNRGTYTGATCQSQSALLL